MKLFLIKQIPVPQPKYVFNKLSCTKSDTKLTTPITINTKSHQSTNHSNRDDIPLLSAETTEITKYSSSKLNPDASSFTLPFSPSNHYQQTRTNNRTANIENVCSTIIYMPKCIVARTRSTTV